MKLFENRKAEAKESRQLKQLKKAIKDNTELIKGLEQKHNIYKANVDKVITKLESKLDVENFDIDMA